MSRPEPHQPITNLGEPVNTTDYAEFAAVAATFYAAHRVGDYWVQTDHQAAHKGGPGWAGRLACGKHVLSYTTTILVMLAALCLATGLTLTVAGVLAGQAVSAITHYLADRRDPLRRIAHALGLRGFWALGAGTPGLGTGPAALDQAWHIGWLWVAALVTVTL